MAVRLVLLSLLRLVVIVIQMAGLMAFFVDYSGWSVLLALPVAVLLAVFMPLVATILGCIGAIKVWLWPWWLALLVFLPGLAFSLTAIAGVGAAGILSMLFFRKRLQAGFRAGRFKAGTFGPGGFNAGSHPHAGQGGQAPQGDTIEGEVLSSRVDGERRE